MGRPKYVLCKREENLILHPMYLRDVKQGVRTHLQSLLQQWQPSLGGVPVSVEHVRLGKPVAALYEDLAPVYAKAEVCWRVFRPQLGALLTGEVHTVSLDHVGLHVGSFNASIARERLPKGTYQESTETFYLDPVDHLDALSLKCGSRITFEVVGIETIGGALSIIGDMTRTGTGYVYKQKRALLIIGVGRKLGEPLGTHRGWLHPAIFSCRV